MMEEITPRMSDEGQQRLLVKLARQYSNPLNVIREYFTNAIDAIDEHNIEDGLVRVLIAKDDNRFIIDDNAIGMDETRVKELPVNIGESIKSEKVDQRGEHAVGLLSFGSAGDMMHLITRKEGDRKFSYLRYEIKNE